MFASKDFIEVSRKFVCIRIETFENKEAEAMVRELLNGRFANTAFCIFDPQGEKKLTRSGRSPAAAVGNRGSKNGQNEKGDDAVIQQMNQIAARFSPTGGDADALLQDFNSFRQALNVAAADQRLLVFVAAKEKERSVVENNLKQVFSESDVLGKFHLNFLDPKVDENWSKKIRGETSFPGIYIIRSGTFGMDGVVMQRLALTESVEGIKSAMAAANGEYSFMEGRKKYSQHVMAGKRQGIYFENEIGREGTSDGRNR